MNAATTTAALYLSRLVLSRSQPQVRRDLACPYDLHRTILRAFPDRAEGGSGRVLFRLEDQTGPPQLLVQSDQPPDWAALEVFPGYAVQVDVKPLAPALRPGQLLRFRLRANPTVTREGRRHGLIRSDEQLGWLQRQGERQGFTLLDAMVASAGRQLTRPAARGRAAQHHQAVCFEGRLRVTDSDRLLQALQAGLGPGKAYGFGLLSLARG